MQVGVDFFYYFYHRGCHRLNVMWATHVVHHQSEEYNLSVALRQPWFSIIYSWVVYMPLAWLGSQVAGLTGFFMGAFTANVLMAALSWYCFRRVLAVERSQMIAV